MTYDEFLANQERIYETSFRQKAEEVRRKGLLPDSAVEQQHGGFIIALRHPPVIARNVARFSRQVAMVVPGAIAYDGLDVHTTISTVGVAPGFRVENHIEHVNLLDKLVKVVKEASGQLGRCLEYGCEISYDSYLYNQTTVIAAGIPKSAFYQIALTIRDYGLKNNLDLRMPWGSHMTVVRFTRKMPAEGIGSFFTLIDNQTGPGKRHVPIQIDIGHFQVDSENGFVFEVYKSVYF